MVIPFGAGFPIQVNALFVFLKAWTHRERGAGPHIQNRIPGRCRLVLTGLLKAGGPGLPSSVLYVLLFCKSS
jgi:hypothetical protein